MGRLLPDLSEQQRRRHRRMLQKTGVRALDCARALLPPHASRAIEPAIAHARVRKHLRVLKKVEITIPSSAMFIVSLGAPELIYSLCFRPHCLVPSNGLTSTSMNSRHLADLPG